METVLLDTMVASAIIKKSDLQTLYKPHIEGRLSAISFQTVAELWKWAEKNNWGEQRRKELEAWFRRFLVLPYDFEVAKLWASVCVHCERKGRRLSAQDAWIVATALQHNLLLLTHDKDIRDAQVPDLNITCLLP